MATIQHMDVNKDSKTHPEITQLVRVILQADPLSVAEGVTNGVPYVIVSGSGKHFTFTKTPGGYSLQTSDYKGTK
jgi:hypothetical protein